MSALYATTTELRALRDRASRLRAMMDQEVIAIEREQDALNKRRASLAALRLELIAMEQQLENAKGVA